MYSQLELYAIRRAASNLEWRALPFNGSLRAILENISAQRVPIATMLPILFDSETLTAINKIDPESPAPAVEIPTNETDLGNALRLVKRFGTDLRYVHDWALWLIWDSQRWRKDDDEAIYRLAKQTAIGIYSEAGAIQGDSQTAQDKRESLAKWAKASESRSRLDAMIELAQSEQQIAITHNRLDRDPWLLNCLNGVLNLRTGELHQSAREHLITKTTGVTYDAYADCPRWKLFLRQTLNDDSELIQFVQRAIGYTLTGDVSEQCLFFLYGTGKNGKSTFIETLIALLGDYAVRTPTETLMLKPQGSIPNDIARLPGARAAVAAETEEGRRLAESTVKDLTGGDTLVARFMRAEYFEFKPSHKIWMYGNHKPLIRGTDEGIWRRLRIIPFTVTIPEDARDPELSAKLGAELPGILAWAVQGCMSWQRAGLPMPRAILDAIRNYRSEMDVIGIWLEECCLVRPGVKALSRNLYANYRAWCEANGESPVSQKRLGMQLTERGFTRRVSGTGQIEWHGVGIVS